MTIAILLISPRHPSSSMPLSFVLVVPHLPSALSFPVFLHLVQYVSICMGLNNCKLLLRVSHNLRMLFLRVPCSLVSYSLNLLVTLKEAL